MGFIYHLLIKNMKKTQLTPPLFRRYNFLKTLLFMKLTTALLLFTCFQVSARVFSQTRITLKLQSTELKKVLSIIERKSSYRFLYNDETVKSGTKVDLDAYNTPVTEVLDQLFTNRSLSYKILDNNLVVITPKNVEVLQTTVTGKIMSSTGEILQGVSVKLKGSSLGTQTDGGGNFSLTVPDNAILVISYVGYVTQEVAIGGRTSININLVPSPLKMDEVVVIGYGTASKRDLTGSIVKILGKDIADKPNTNPVASLQGKVAGLSIVNSGKPGQEPDVRLRGTVSRTQTKPLYIVDGIFTDNIDFVNPNDIESIEVLKDASSLAIFGVRGANGAIAIVTKKGKIGQLTVNFNTSVGVQKIVDKLALVDATGYKTLLKEQISNTNSPAYPYLDLYKGNTDWQDQISQNGIINVNNISVTSGNERNRFYLGLGYTSQEGLIKHELLKKYSLSITDELKVSKALKIGFNFNGYKSELPQLQSFGDANRAAPIIEPFNSKFGVYNQTPFGLQSGQVTNPLAVVEETHGQSLSNVYRAIGNIFAEVNFLKNFTFKATYYADLTFFNNRRYTPIARYYNAVTDKIDTTTSKTQVSQADNLSSKFQQDYLLTYKKQFGDHGLTLLGGFATIYNSFHETSGLVSQFTSGNANIIPNDKRFWYLDNFFADPSSRAPIPPARDLFGNPAPLEWEQTTASYFARALYNYKGKYLLNASFRRDGSSDVSPNHRYQNFAAVGAAWELTQEDFMQNQKLFDFVKLKTSYGILGNQYTAIHYPFYPLLTGASATFGPGGNQVPIFGYSPSFVPDPDLHWETITSTDIGIELGLMKNRLRIEAAYFKKLTKDLLTNYPGLSGQKPGITNAGNISNTGIELSASWSDKFENGLSYTVSGNLTTLKNKVVSVFKEGYEIFDGPTRTRAGDPIGSFYGYIVDGVYQNAADSANSPNNGYRPGDLKFRDVNGDKKISDADRTVIGNPTPKGIYGFSISVNYKGFDLGMDFQGVYGNQLFRSWGNGANYARLTYRAARLNRWHGDGTSNWEPLINDFSAANQLASTYMIEDGSYLRIRNLQLGYNFNQAQLKKVNIKSARIYVSAQNLKTFKHNFGYTPETGGSALNFGSDNGGYPLPAIFTAGINLSF
jgi:TonB-linked SusC/RagA family outer membrane protein